MIIIMMMMMMMIIIIIVFKNITVTSLEPLTLGFFGTFF